MRRRWWDAQTIKSAARARKQINCELNENEWKMKFKSQCDRCRSNNTEIAINGAKCCLRFIDFFHWGAVKRQVIIFLLCINLHTQTLCTRIPSFVRPVRMFQLFFFRNYSLSLSFSVLSIRCEYFFWFNFYHFEQEVESDNAPVNKNSNLSETFLKK